jgi:hypothetical protein
LVEDELVDEHVLVIRVGDAYVAGAVADSRDPGDVEEGGVRDSRERSDEAPCVFVDGLAPMADDHSLRPRDPSSWTGNAGLNTDHRIDPIMPS